MLSPASPSASSSGASPRSSSTSRAPSSSASSIPSSPAHHHVSSSTLVDETEIDDAAPNLLRLKGAEGHTVKITKQAAQLSGFLKHALAEKDRDLIDVGEIASDTLDKIATYLLAHEKSPPLPLERKIWIQHPNLQQFILDKFDRKFSNFDQATVFQILLAAHHLDIKPLAQLMSVKIAFLIKGKTAEQIRKTFNISSDYSPAEEDQVKKAYPECFQ